MSSTLITTPFGADVDGGGGDRGRRSDRQAGDRHRRIIGNWGRNRPRARVGRGRGDARRARAGAGRRTAADITATTGNDRVLVARLDLADLALGPRVRVRLDRPAAHSGQQRGGHGHAGAAHRAGLGAAVRHQPPRPLRADHRPARRARGGGRGPGGGGQLGRSHQRRDAVRRPQLRAPPVRPVGGLQPVQDREHPVRGRGGQALGRRPDRGQRAQPGSDQRDRTRPSHDDRADRVRPKGSTGVS